MGVKKQQALIQQRDELGRQYANTANSFVLNWYINKHSNDAGFVYPATTQDIPEIYLREANTELNTRTEWAQKSAEYKYGINVSYDLIELNEKKKNYTSSISNVNQGSCSGLVAMDTENIYIIVEQTTYVFDQLENALNVEDNNHEQFTSKEHVEVPEQGDHIYPIVLVAETTNKLIDYNNQLESYIKDVKEYEAKLRASIEKGPGKINLTWLSKIVEKFCKRMNFWLANLRYYLIKALSGIYKGFNKSIELIEGFYEVVEGLLHININTIVTGVIKFATGFLKIINRPIEAFIQFVADVGTYTPPLVEEAGDLVTQVTDAADYGTDLANEIHSTVQQTLNSGLSPEIVERLARKYTNIEDIDFDIKFETITLADIITGNPEKPKWEDYK